MRAGFDALVVDFRRRLVSRHVEVVPARSLVALQALGALSDHSREQMYWALRASMVSRAEDHVSRDIGLPRAGAGRRRRPDGLQISSGVPLTTISEQCGTSVAMIEQHYAGRGEVARPAARRGGSSARLTGRGEMTRDGFLALLRGRHPADGGCRAPWAPRRRWPGLI